MTLELQGIQACAGIAVGAAYLVKSSIEPAQKKNIAEAQIDLEIIHFNQAVAKVREELIQVQRELVGESLKATRDILQAHIAILSDPKLLQGTQERIRKEQVSAEWAWVKTVEGIKENLRSIADNYIRTRVVDLDYAADRVISSLRHDSNRSAICPPAGSIIVAHDLSPGDTAQLNRYEVAGIAIEIGSPTSHTAIVARGFGIPAVVGLGADLFRIAAGDLMMVDGNRGCVVLKPEPELLLETKAKIAKAKKDQERLQGHRMTPATTNNGRTIVVGANVNHSTEIQRAQEQGADGVGLLRTEYLFLNRDQLPSVEEQICSYQKAVEQAGKATVTIRTMDLGSDKLPAGAGAGKNANPALGVRGIRLSLLCPALFETQLSAILQVSHQGAVQILFPVVSTLDELQQAKDHLLNAKQNLRAEGLPFNENIPVGVMVEVPAVALMAKYFAQEVDFLSIGSNDLIQYVFAADRMNEKVAHLYLPFHPVILRLIASVADAGHEKQKRICLCGEMASNPYAIPLLLGLGVDELGVNVPMIAEIKQLIRSVSTKDCQELAAKALSLSKAKEVEALAVEFCQDRQDQADGKASSRTIAVEQDAI